MRSTIPVSRLTLYRLAIPMRRSFRHAGAERCVSEPLVVQVELADGTLGYGETHPRPYVTGETIESAIAAIREVYVPRLLEFRPARFGEAIEAAAALPVTDEQGRVATAARAAVELGVLDAYSRAFDKSLEQLAGWHEESRFGSPGSAPTVRYSGIVAAVEPARAVASIRKMRLVGLRDFKIKVGDDDDDARLRAVAGALRRPLSRGKATLRVDVNGEWGLEEAVEKLARWREIPLACVEQPLPRNDNKAAAELSGRTTLPLMADESLVSLDDAEDLIVRRAAAWFNIRISKNGGLLPSLQLAALARRHGIACQLGCMVGETSILSAAGRWFLQIVPDVGFAEGSYGRFALCGDVVRRSIRFGLGGRWRPMSGPGLGVQVEAAALERLAVDAPIEIPF